MTIKDLEQRLDLKLSQRVSIQGLSVNFSQPYRLMKCLERVEARFDKIESRQPSEGKILYSIEKFERNYNVDLTSRDWKNIAWGLCVTFEKRPDKMIFMDSGYQALMRFKNLHEDLTPSLFIALLFSYFSVSQHELNKNSSAWLVLRNILKESFNQILIQSKKHKPWMLVLQQYPELLETQPTRRIAIDLINDADDQDIIKITEKIKASANCWLWEDIINQAVNNVCNLSDGNFILKIDRLINIYDRHPIYQNIILTKMLDRYSLCAHRDEVHVQLKNLSLNLWGNPQYDSSVGWNNVKLQTKKMVAQWFIKADLEAFFRLFNEDADERRFNYWMRFIKNASFSKILLGSYAARSNNYKYNEYRKQNKGRFGYLEGTIATNNAFVMQIGNCFIVEFSEVGPCYISQINMIGRRNIFDMKDLRVGDGFKHLGYWETNKFDPALKAKGIYPDY